jgi:hypothetical protein
MQYHELKQLANITAKKVIDVQCTFDKVDNPLDFLLGIEKIGTDLTALFDKHTFQEVRELGNPDEYSQKEKAILNTVAKGGR